MRGFLTCYISLCHFAPTEDSGHNYERQVLPDVCACTASTVHKEDINFAFAQPCH